MSPVKHTAHDFPVSTWTHREVLALMDRAEEKAGPEDVGEQALMRGLDTAFPFVRLGLILVAMEGAVGRTSASHDSSGPQPPPTLRLSMCHELAIDRPNEGGKLAGNRRGDYGSPLALPLE